MKGNQATQLGGGVFTAGASLTIRNSYIGDNRAFEQGGGIYNDRSPMTIFSTTIADNRAGLMGGGIANYGNSALTNTAVRGNSAVHRRDGHGPAVAERRGLLHGGAGDRLAGQTIDRGAAEDVWTAKYPIQ